MLNDERIAIHSTVFHTSFPFHAILLGLINHKLIRIMHICNLSRCNIFADCILCCLCVDEMCHAHTHTHISMHPHSAYKHSKASPCDTFSIVIIMILTFVADCFQYYCFILLSITRVYVYTAHHSTMLPVHARLLLLLLLLSHFWPSIGC